MKVLAVTRRKYAEEIGRHIFSICIVENRPETESQKQGNYAFLSIFTFLTVLVLFTFSKENVSLLFVCTVKPVYIDHPSDPKIVASLTGGRCSEVALRFKSSKWWLL